MTSLHSNERPPDKPWLAIGVVVALLIVAVNLAGYLWYTTRNAPESPTPKPVAAVDTPAETTTTKTGTPQLAEERREAGVVALRSGQYAKAIANFEAAIKLDPNVADAPVLLDVAKNLQASEAAADDEPVAKRAPPPPVKPVVAEVVEAPPPRVAARSRRTRRTPRRKKRAERVARTEAPEEEDDEPGVLEVTTEPSGLDVSIDGGPADRSPVTISLEAGEHSVRISRNGELLEERTVEVESGERERVSGDYAARIARAQPPPAPTPDPSAIGKQEDLDLVALIDRDAPKTTTTEPKVPAPDAAAPKLTPTPGGSPRLVVFWPGRSGSGLQQSMRSEMNGVDVRVVTRTGDLRRALSSPTDALMASPYVLRQNGLAPALSAKSTASGRYLAVSLGQTPVKSALANQTIGVVDELGRNRMPIFVQQLIGSSRTPTLRRVTKVEDLLPLLQFSIAKVVLVKERDFPVLKSRTQQKLFTLPVTARAAPLAVAFADGGRRSMVERAVRNLGNETRQSLGVESWSN